jgi:hypothetical protein
MHEIPVNFRGGHATEVIPQSRGSAGHRETVTNEQYAIGVGWYWTKIYGICLVGKGSDAYWFCNEPFRLDHRSESGQ